MSPLPFQRKEEPKTVQEEPIVHPAVTSEEPKVVEEARPTVLVSELDAYVADRLKSQPKTLTEVEVIADRESASDIRVLALPRELEPYCNKYAFRWISKKKRAIDYHIDVVGWTLVNRIYFNDLPKHLFTANGSVERGDLILGFMPMKRATVLRGEPGKRSAERVHNLPVPDLENWKKEGEQYYKPEAGPESEETSRGLNLVVD